MFFIKINTVSRQILVGKSDIELAFVLYACNICWQRMVTHRPRAWELAIKEMRLLLAEQNSLFASYKEAIANTVLWKGSGICQHARW